MSYENKDYTKWTNDDYEKYNNDTLSRLGFDPEKLTKNQKDAILEPLEAPENYMCDGEISPAQALSRWKQKLAQNGLTPVQVRQAVKAIIG
jgi:hypothetical protein